MMENVNEATLGLRLTLLVYVIALIGALAFLIVKQSQDLDQIYAASDGSATLVRHGIIPAKVDTAGQTP